MNAPLTRLVDRLVIHGPPISFRELCARAVPESTRLLVLDLDRTMHLARNMGELLGWELCAYQGYGPEHLPAIAARPPGRFFLDRSRPSRAVRYLATTARMWGYPGLFYFLWGKLPSLLASTRRGVYRRFGPDPVAAVQRIPQLALMHHMAQVPVATLRTLAQQVWDRHAADQVVEREDLAWLRERCPGIRIVISSASPQPALEVAARALGVEDVVSSGAEEAGGAYSSPYQVDRLFLVPKPRRISGPSAVRINSSHAKIERLLTRFPELADRSVTSVGITDTGYGEDHSWAEHFTRVVDLNSSAPFPPIVPARSPTREIHSALALTRGEKARRAGGDGAYVDPRRAEPLPAPATLGAAELGHRLGPLAGQVERVAQALAGAAARIGLGRVALAAELARVNASLDDLARAYNAAPESGRGRGRALAALRAELGRMRAVQRRLARLERPVSALSYERMQLLTAARATLQPTVAGRGGEAGIRAIGRETRGAP